MDQTPRRCISTDAWLPPRWVALTGSQLRPDLLARIVRFGSVSPFHEPISNVGSSALKRVTDIMAEIAAALQEQSDGILQVSQAIGQMDQVTQQNAALVEEAAAATESMQEQTRQLVEAVSVFRLAARFVQHPAAARTTAPNAAVRAQGRPTLLVAGTRNAVPAKERRLQMQPAASPDSEWEEF